MTTIEANEIQYCRDVEKLFDRWMEFVLEVNEYAKMNEIQRKDSLDYLLSIVKDYLGMCNEILHGFPDECEEIPMRLNPLYDRCISKISDAIFWARGIK